MLINVDLLVLGMIMDMARSSSLSRRFLYPVVVGNARAFANTLLIFILMINLAIGLLHAACGVGSVRRGVP
jgi:TRAP-type C4-dicarboxylate transport system permease large subunit